MSDKYEISFSLDVLKRYVVFFFKKFYGEYIVVGRENIPTDCPIIFAPNHVNALMDALAVHSVVPSNLPVTFLARSDMFNKKHVAKMLYFVKMLPAFRMRDGVENLGRNAEIFDKCVDILHHNKSLGIMPEGNQGEDHKLRPLVKGIFRIAFAAQEKYGTTPAVKIIPIGIDFGHLVKFGKHIIINIGKPIEVSDYMKAYAENPVTATNDIREKLRSDLNASTLDLATDTYNKCFETAVEVAYATVQKQQKLPNSTVFKFVAKQKVAAKLVEIENTDSKKIVELAILCSEYKANLKKLKLRSWLFEHTNFSRVMLLFDSLMLLCTLPIFLNGFILNVLPFFTPVWLRKAMKVEYGGFNCSLHFTFSLFSFPIFYTIQTVLFAYFVASTWWIVITFYISQYILGKWSLAWYNEFRKHIAKLRFNVFKRRKNPVFEKTQDLHKKIVQLINI
jgi:1-acyl-sn-glycerol-3-phosphate acyltransferase